MEHPFRYQRENQLNVAEFRDVLVRSGLAARRPVDDEARLRTMCEKADIIMTCRHIRNGLLLGIARSLTDFSYCTYLSDLAVDAAWQKHGIGKKLIAATHEQAGLQTTLILLSAPAARTYYPHIGLEKHESCWLVPAKVLTGD